MVLKFSKLLKWCFLMSTVTTVLLMLANERSRQIFEEYNFHNAGPLAKPTNNWRNFSDQQRSKLSELGRILFLDESPPRKRDGKFKILIWKYGPFLERRHIKHFTADRHDPFEKCSVSNCELTYDSAEIKTADAVLFHLQRMNGVADLPEDSQRSAQQRWVFLTDETPYHTFFHKVKLKDFNGKFNWSMTYRMDSDVPVPYGRTLLKEGAYSPEEESFKKRIDVLVAIMGSNCGGNNERWKYVRELQKHIDVDVYGRCGPLKCPGHFDSDCDTLSNYKFYLSFENSNCAQYITEKLWWNAFAKNAVPIVMGASKSDYVQLLPPKSFINVEDFASPADLARYLIYLNRTMEEYREYFEWKRYYRISNEHGYFQTDSYHYCRLCEAMNYNNEQEKVYNDLEAFWSTKDCYPSWNSG